MEAGKGKHNPNNLIGVAVDNIFQKYDENHNNYIDFDEFCKMVYDLHLSLIISHKELASIF